jgi:DNA repair protein RadA/Sms
VLLNITVGIRLEDPAIDLVVIFAILSSDLNMTIPTKTCFCEEVGLSDEIIPVKPSRAKYCRGSSYGIYTHYSVGFQPKKSQH